MKNAVNILPPNVTLSALQGHESRTFVTWCSSLYNNLNSACSLVVLCSCVVKFSLSTVSLGQCSVRVTSASLFAPLSTKCYTFVICKKFLFTVLSGNFAGGELKCLQSAQFGKSFFLTKNTNVCRKNKVLRLHWLLFVCNSCQKT